MKIEHQILLLAHRTLILYAISKEFFANVWIAFYFSILLLFEQGYYGWLKLPDFWGNILKLNMNKPDPGKGQWSNFAYLSSRNFSSKLLATFKWMLRSYVMSTSLRTQTTPKKQNIFRKVKDPVEAYNWAWNEYKLRRALKSSLNSIAILPMALDWQSLHKIRIQDWKSWLAKWFSAHTHIWLVKLN